MPVKLGKKEELNTSSLVFIALKCGLKTNSEPVSTDVTRVVDFLLLCSLQVEVS